MAVVFECYVRGVSTRRVDGLVKTLGVESLSKSQVSRMAAELDEMVTEFRNRPLENSPELPGQGEDRWTETLLPQGVDVGPEALAGPSTSSRAPSRSSSS